MELPDLPTFDHESRDLGEDLDRLADQLILSAIYAGTSGSPVLDTKRPFGNADLQTDILEILGVEYDDVLDETSMFPNTFSASARQYATSLWQRLGRHVKVRYRQLLDLESD